MFYSQIQLNGTHVSWIECDSQKSAPLYQITLAKITLTVIQYVRLIKKYYLKSIIKY